MEHQNGTDRRGYPRYSVSIPVWFSSEMLDFQSTAELLEGQVADISRDGLFIRSDFLEVPGTPVRLSLRVPASREAIHLDGKVAWVRERPPKGPGMGIHLSDGPIEERLFGRLFQCSAQKRLS